MATATGLANRVKETTTTTGTGNITLAGAATGYQTFSTAFAVGDLISYVIAGGSEWEVGLGQLSGSTTLVRDTVLNSSNADALVSFSAGTKDVFCSPAAETTIESGKAIAMAGRLQFP